MRLVPHNPSSQTWEQFYKAMADGHFKPTRRVQYGAGRGLGRKGGRGYSTINEGVQTQMVAPTEMAVQQARSELKNRQHSSHGPVAVATATGPWEEC